MVYADEASFPMGTSDVTLYAKWTATHAVTFDSNGGTGTMDPLGVEENTQATLSDNTLTRTGYTFAGWATTSSGIVVYADEASFTMGTSDVPLYAKWTANAYIITLDPSSGTGGTPNITATYNADMPSAAMPNRIGYTFAGYYDDTEGSGIQYYDSTMSSSHIWDKTDITTLYAKWTANTYIITLDPSSGTGGTPNITATYNADMPSATMPNRIGYTFAGYYDETEGSGIQYYDSTMSSSHIWDKTDINTLYANWAVIYTVTFDSQDATTSADPTTKTVIVPATLIDELPTDPEKTDYIFDGWFTGESGGGSEFTSSTTVTSNITVYAKWVVTLSKLKAMINNGEDITTLDTSRITDMSELFINKSSFNQDISGWDVSSVTDMSWMFYGASSFNQDLSDWVVSSVTNMNKMFDNAAAFSGDISSWDVSSVTNMSYMFDSSFNGDISSWFSIGNKPDDGYKITNMSYMFGSSFNQDLSGWDVSSVTNMSGMFSNARAFNQVISGWDVSSVTDMNAMFSGASIFNQNISGWDVSSVTRMSRMFSNASAFDQDVSGWNVSSVTDMSGMFFNATAFNQDISIWEVGIVTDMQSMFGSDSGLLISFNQNLSEWDVSSVTNMYYMFHANSSFNGDISGWDVSSVKNMNGMFYAASTFNQNLSDWDVSSVTDMSWMFYAAIAFNQDISGWFSKEHIPVDKYKILNMGNMFLDASAFNQDLSGWDVSSVTSMGSMFKEASAFNQDLSGWDVSSVTDMRSMFDNASAFNQDLSGWGVSSVTKMDGMFRDASLFNGNISSWDVSSVRRMPSMFDGASAFNQDISDWVVSSVTTMSYMFDGASAFNQDLSGWDVSSVSSYIDFSSGDCPLSTTNHPVQNWDS